jgi:hypothetical protein
MAEQKADEENEALFLLDFQTNGMHLLHQGR